MNSTVERKAKKSYSRQSVQFLERMRKKRRASSTSAVLDEILLAARREQERAALEKAVESYYSEISDAEAAEQARWGDFAEREFPGEEHV